MSIKGDFISFSYNGVHSTDLGIVRVSSSNRYNDLLIPTSQDKTAPIPGSNGTYFFGSQYTQRVINVDIAFDEVTETQIRTMRKLFGDKKVHQLIFDDEPYKVYYAVVTGIPQLKYIPFNSPRVYKGEGTINFSCYDPFAHCPNDYKNKNVWVAGGQNAPSWYKYDNVTEWNLGADLVTTIGSTYDNYNSSTKTYKLYNPGDIESDFYLVLPFTNINTLTEIKISNTNNTYSKVLKLKQNFEAKTINNQTDTHVRFNSRLNMIEGLYNGVLSGNIYNECIGGGDWPKVPVNISSIDINLVLTGYTGTPTSLKYDYLYY